MVAARRAVCKHLRVNRPKVREAEVLAVELNPFTMDSMPDTFAIRPYHPSDLPTLYDVCLLTGDNGNDGSALFRDPELLGHYFTAPYCVLEPDLAFVLTHNGAPVGYVLGARDSVAFGRRCEAEWFPVLRQRYALPEPADTSKDAWMQRAIHHGYTPPHGLDNYPAHLHIDLLPVGQGQGWGRKLIETLLARLRELGAPGVHLGVGSSNLRAIAFYEKVGFQRLQTHDGWIAYGMLL